MKKIITVVLETLLATAIFLGVYSQANADWVVVPGSETHPITAEICGLYGIGAEVLVTEIDNVNPTLNDYQSYAINAAYHHAGNTDKYIAWSMLYDDASKVQVAIANPNMVKLSIIRKEPLVSTIGFSAEASCKARIGQTHTAPKRQWRDLKPQKSADTYRM